jgi:biopolymer transport protein TolQ
VSADLSIVHLVVNASPLVQLVVLLLLAASVASWTLIFQKRSALKAAGHAADEFERSFWSGGDLNTLYEKGAARSASLSGMENLFQAGFKEFIRLRKQSGTSPMESLEGAQRVMRTALNRETDNLENHLAFLATVGSTSPYVGLFGTVWGIMNSFRALGNVHQATLAMVAPGISEALIATAMGLFAAIPAVVAYNRYTNQTERLVHRYNNFMEEFSSILQRQLHVVVP